MDIRKFFKQDYIITILIVVLLTIGTLVIYGATLNSSDARLLQKQLFLIAIGLLGYFFIMVIDIEWFKVLSIQLLLYTFIIATLLYVNILGSNIAGTNRWIDFGFFSFQPSEYAKIIIILFISYMYSSERLPIREQVLDFQEQQEKPLSIINKLKKEFKKALSANEVRSFLWTIIYVSPIIFLTFIQPALGNTIILLTLFFFNTIFSLKNIKSILSILILFAVFTFFVLQLLQFDKELGIFSINFQSLNYMAITIYSIVTISIILIFRIKAWRALLVSMTVAILTLFSVFLWNNILGNYQRKRVITFLLGPEIDPLGSGFQIIQSQIAIGSGRLLGRGYLQGTQSSLHILTQAHTDFAFASMSEQFGFIGAVIVLLIFVFLILRILKVSRETKSAFGKNFCFGVTSLLLIHIFINVGMNIGKLPVTGIPLPLISYGGSSVLMTLIVLGLVQSIYTSRRPVDMSDSLMITSLRGKEVSQEIYE